MTSITDYCSRCSRNLFISRIVFLVVVLRVRVCLPDADFDIARPKTIRQKGEGLPHLDPRTLDCFPRGTGFRTCGRILENKNVQRLCPFIADTSTVSGSRFEACNSTDQASRPPAILRTLVKPYAMK